MNFYTLLLLLLLLNVALSMADQDVLHALGVKMSPNLHVLLTPGIFEQL